MNLSSAFIACPFDIYFYLIFIFFFIYYVVFRILGFIPTTELSTLESPEAAYGLFSSEAVVIDELYMFSLKFHSFRCFHVIQRMFDTFNLVISPSTYRLFLLFHKYWSLSVIPAANQHAVFHPFYGLILNLNKYQLDHLSRRKTHVLNGVDIECRVGQPTNELRHIVRKIKWPQLGETVDANPPLNQLSTIPNTSNDSHNRCVPRSSMFGPDGITWHYKMADGYHIKVYSKCFDHNAILIALRRNQKNTLFCSYRTKLPCLERSTKAAEISSIWVSC